MAAPVNPAPPLPPAPPSRVRFFLPSQYYGISSRFSEFDALTLDSESATRSLIIKETCQDFFAKHPTAVEDALKVAKWQIAIAHGQNPGPCPVRSRLYRVRDSNAAYRLDAPLPSLASTKAFINKKIADVFHARHRKNTRGGQHTSLLPLNLSRKVQRTMSLRTAFFHKFWHSDGAEEASRRYRAYLANNPHEKASSKLSLRFTHEVANEDFTKMMEDPNTRALLEAEVANDRKRIKSESEAMVSMDSIKRGREALAVTGERFLEEVENLTGMVGLLVLGGADFDKGEGERTVTIVSRGKTREGIAFEKTMFCQDLPTRFLEWLAHVDFDSPTPANTVQDNIVAPSDPEMPSGQDTSTSNTLDCISIAPAVAPVVALDGLPGQTLTQAMPLDLAWTYEPADWMTGFDAATNLFGVDGLGPVGDVPNGHGLPPLRPVSPVFNFPDTFDPPTNTAKDVLGADPARNPAPIPADLPSSLPPPLPSSLPLPLPPPPSPPPVNPTAMICPADAPAWIKQIWDMLKSGSGVPAVRAVITTFFIFEEARNWVRQAPGLAANHSAQPHAVKAFRASRKDFIFEVASDMAKDLPSQLPLWWAAIQPASRGSSLLRVAPPSHLDWGKLSVGGSTGVGLVVLALCWWAAIPSRNDVALRVLCDDVMWVLREMTKVVPKRRLPATPVGNQTVLEQPGKRRRVQTEKAREMTA